MPSGSFVSYGRTHRIEQETHVATLSTGYGDGYPRALSGKGFVLLDGTRHPIIGRITMDHFMVDLGPFTGIRPGAVATLLGRDGTQELRAEEISSWIDAIPYEIPTAVAPRVKRRYLGEELPNLQRIRSIA
jgi:alanine racemase